MGHDREILFLAWLNRQPAGFALAKEMPGASPEELQRLENRGLILRVPSREPGGDHGYVITAEGKKYQEGD